jgi:endonuclease III
MGLVSELVQNLGGGFASQLGINLSLRDDKSLFRWWLASLFFGARISESIAVKTFRIFDGAGLDSPSRILEQGWDGLVALLDQGGYVRYDFKTADKLLAVSKKLLEEYQGSLNQLHDVACDPQDLEARLKALGKGVGEVTVGIFLRELRGIWPKANPPLGSLALFASEHLGIIGDEAVKRFWHHQSEDISFPDFESALVRLAKNYCRKHRCADCPVARWCESSKD